MGERHLLDDLSWTEVRKPDRSETRKTALASNPERSA